MTRPKPRQVSQAPSGLLNENRFGDRLADGEAAARARERRREAQRRAAGVGQEHGGAAAAVAEGLLERVDEAAAVGGAQHEPVLDDGDGVAGRRRGERPRARRRPSAPSTRRSRRASRPVARLGPGQAGRQRRARRRRGRARPACASSRRVGGALGRVARDRRAAGAAVRHADLGEEQLQVVVQLGHRADGRARRLHRAALVDGDRRAGCRRCARPAACSMRSRNWRA